MANVSADSNVHVVAERMRRPMIAAELVGDERTIVWDEVRHVWPRIEAYEGRAGRPIPVFRLTEVDDNVAAREGRVYRERSRRCATGERR